MFDYLRKLCVDVKAVRLRPDLAKLRSLTGFITKQALTFPYYASAELRNWVETKRAQGLALEVAFSSSMAPYLRNATVPTVVDMVDVDSAKWREYSEKKNNIPAWIYGREAKLLAEAEKEIAQWTDATYLISSEERELLVADDGLLAQKVDWYGNGVDTDYFSPEAGFKANGENCDLAFVGAMDYWANEEAVIWFADYVWPLLKKNHPELSFAIVGGKPGASVLRLAQLEGITVTGRVPDVRPWLASARVVIAPLRIARGVQNKVLEAMAMAKPVVSTSAALTGISANAGEHLLVADTPEDTVVQIQRMLADRSFAEQMGRVARHLVTTHYSWDSQIAKLAQKNS